ncbi:PRD domain-containing protein [Atopobacter sp. AH10]|uniref:BglG family transcription antiterminator n=1 Tax=Atopobacter sp. AH10 TaxID=2315861 RepID=UPI000EF20178|nr:BglG family transcription antiterminator [Atopobacter sp. AH10]RLK63817.1 PRD domain-containing protein [Atopobacter sp. AH10]
MGKQKVLNNREYNILSYLKKFPNTYLTSQQLANALHLSDKTIRKYLKSLTRVLAEEGAVIEATPGYGYQFRIDDEKLFYQFWKMASQQQAFPRDVVQVEEARDRQFFILHRFFFDQWRPHIRDIEDELYLSITSVKNVLNECRELLKPYQLTIDYGADHYLYIKGDELDQRHFMMDYFFTPKYGNALNPYIDPSFLPEGVSFESLTIVVLDECREAQLLVSDFVIQNLVLHLALTIKRIQLGYPLLSPTNIKKEDAKLERTVAEAILKRIQKMMAITFPEEEVQYVAIHLSGKSHPRLNQKNADGQKYKSLVDLLEEMSAASEQAFEVDPILVEGLLTHLETLKVRLSNDIQLDNPLIGEITQEHGQVLEECRHYLSSLKELRGQNVTDDEWGYMALHILAARERYKARRKIRVLVVCATGYGSAQMLKSRLENSLGQSILIVDVMSYYQLNAEQLGHIDLLISAIDLSHIWLPVPYVFVNVFLSDKDIRNIQEKIKEIRPNLEKGEDKSKLNLPREENKGQAEEIFQQHFDPSRFLIIEANREKESLLDDLIKTLNKSPMEDFVGKMKDQLKLRESMGGVVFGEEVAVPHPTTALTEEAQVAVAILKHPIVWNDQHKGVRMVFLISPSSYSNPHLIQVSQAIGQWTNDKALRQALMKEPCFKRFKALMVESLQRVL